MPIQNIGTLIENLVVTESAGALMDDDDASDTLGFATAFAMPSLSEWRPHAQSVGMSDRALKQIRESRGDTDFLAAMSACLHQFPDRGPNGALLVAVLAAIRNRRLRVRGQRC